MPRNRRFVAGDYSFLRLFAQTSAQNDTCAEVPPPCPHSYNIPLGIYFGGTDSIDMDRMDNLEQATIQADVGRRLLLPHR